MTDRMPATAAELCVAVNQQLRVQPLTEDDLLDALVESGLNLGDDPEGAVADILQSDDLPEIIVLPDGRLASVAALLNGLTFTHRLSAREVEHDILQIEFDIAPLWFLFDDAERPLTLKLSDDPAAKDEAISGIHPYAEPERYEERGIPLAAPDSEGDVLLPVGALARLGVGCGDLVRLQLTDTRLDLRRVEATSFGSPDVLAQALHDVVADSQPTETALAMLQVCADHPELFAAPTAPLSEVAESAGLQIHGGWIATGDFDFEVGDLEADAMSILSLYDVDEEQAVAIAEFKAAHAAISEWISEATAGPDTEARGRDLIAAGDLPFNASTLVTLSLSAPYLADPDVTETLADSTLSGNAIDAAALGGMADLLLDGSPPARIKPALEWLKAKAHYALGLIDEAEQALRRSESLDHRWRPALVDLATLASDRGDAVGAVSLLRRAGDDPYDLIPFLQRFQPVPRPGLGRNQPCWCGSGRKYKVCHLNKEEKPLGERAHWLYRKALTFLDHPAWRPVVFGLAALRSAHLDSDEALEMAFEDPLVADAALFEGGAFEEFLEVKGPLLPDDERLLGQQWLLIERSVFEIQTVDPDHGFTCRDVRTGDVQQVQEIEGSTQLTPGELFCGRIVPVDDSLLVFGGLEPVTLAQRDALIELLDSEPDPDELVAFLSARFAPPELRNTEGEPTVFCQTRMHVADPDGMAESLNSRYERQTGDDEAVRWCEYVTTDGMERVRAIFTLDGDELLIESNSEARQQRALSVVHDLDPRSTIIHSSQRTAAEMLKAARRSDEPAELSEPADPAIDAAMEEYIRGYEESWLDMTIPALADCTPREAAADPTRRDDLIRLLDSFPAADRPGAMDPERLRRALGLD